MRYDRTGSGKSVQRAQSGNRGQRRAAAGTFAAAADRTGGRDFGFRIRLLSLALVTAGLSAAAAAPAEVAFAREDSGAADMKDNAEGTESGGQRDAAAGGSEDSAADTVSAGKTETVTLRVCNWEEYIDEGDWDEEETIDLPSGDIIGENSVVEDFEQWYYDTYGIRVNVEYSTAGTNEDLYNMLTLGDVYDLVCPSEYMIMKLMAENRLVPLSEHFFDTSDENNYYARGVSPYIQNIFETEEIGGEPWSRYAAGYMWGVTGIVYNPEAVTREEASTWKILDDPKFKRRITIKDNVRDSYFAAVGAVKSDLLTSGDFLSSPDYAQRLEEEMNDTSPGTVAAVQEYLQSVKDNAYSFETDSGKADMITGKVVANYQWSGDAVYTLDQADEDGYRLDYAVPAECTNIYFDGWVMLRSGIDGDSTRQHAAEAFINFVSRPDNAIRNMYYIGYTSAIAGGEDPRIFEYARWNYEADEENTDTADYDLRYFFAEDGRNNNNYIIKAPADQADRQLRAAYPSHEDMARASIMRYFDAEQSARINQMWIHVRCFDIRKVPVWGWILTAAVLTGIIILAFKGKRRSWS